MRRLLPAVVLAVTAACGSSPAAPSAPNNPTPPPIPEASLVMSGGLEAVPGTCTSTQCQYKGQGTNNGQGCAVGVNGKSTLYDAAGKTLAAYQFSLDAATVVKPATTFAYFVTVQQSEAAGVAQFFTQFQWTNVACQ